MATAGSGTSDWHVLGRLTQASNATMLVELEGRRFVYKPVAGESPLWDFPRGTLGRREVAVFEIASVLGWDIVPPTRWVEEGPYGPGMLQDWIEEENSPVGLFAEDGVPDGWLSIARGYDADDRQVVLAHCDSMELQQMAVFDVIINNADRKGGHVFGSPGGRVSGIDHGVSLHEEPKLRTVLWGFVGRTVPAHLLEDIDRAVPQLGDRHEGVSATESDALVRRATRILHDPVFPRPSRRGPAFPWPPL